MIHGTSPTGYYVISSYSVISALANGNTCSPSYGLPVQTGPFSYPFRPNQPGLSLAYAEISFEYQVGLTCSGIGVDLTHMTITPIVLATGGPTVTATVKTLPTVTEGTNTKRSIRTTIITAAAALPTSPSLTIAGSNASTSPSASVPKAALLSAGAKIGLGIGIPLAVVAVTMLGFYLWRRDRRQTQAKKLATNSKPEDYLSTYLQGKPELDGEQDRHEADANLSRREVEANERYELEVKERRQELRSEDHLQELEVPLHVAAGF